MIEDQESIQDFLIESNRNLGVVEREIVQLEERPGDVHTLGSIFRTFHTIKGTCGFLGFEKLEHITHQAESLLGALRDGTKTFIPHFATLILETVDVVNRELLSIEKTGKESSSGHEVTLARLAAALNGEPPPEAAPPRPAQTVEETEPPSTEAKGNLAGSTIRMDVQLLDRLINLVGELVLVRNQVLADPARNEPISQRLNSITTELQESVMRSRMQPVETVWGKLPRLVRDAASSLSKDIRLTMEGAGTEMDRAILEAVKDPLTHMLRNSCDHGLELPADRLRAGKPAQGHIELRAFHEGGQVVMEIRDDGRGIDPVKVKAKAVERGLITAQQAAAMPDPEAVNLIFAAGFSTAETITNISGRGVGMDVVKKNIQKIGGQVEVLSRVGVGTTLRIRIPLTLAILPGLIVKCSGQTFIIPQVNLVELLRLQGDALSALDTTHESPLLRRRGRMMPVAELRHVLKLPPQSPADAVNIVILRAAGHEFGIIVDRILSTREIVVKPLGKHFQHMRWYAGATVLGDGTLALILDVAGLAAKASLLGHGINEHTEPANPLNKVQQLLLFRCGGMGRLGLPVSQVDRLEKIPRERIETAAGKYLVQYNGALLKLAPLAELLETGGAECLDRDLVNVLVIRDGWRVIGLAVDEILDIRSGVLSGREQSRRPGLLGTVVFDGQSTDLLDLPLVLTRAYPDWNRVRTTPRRRMKIVLCSPSAFTRAVLRNYLELANHEVLEAATGNEALDFIEGKDVDAVVAALDCAPLGAAELGRTIRNRTAAGPIPVVGLSLEGSLAEPPDGLDEVLYAFDRLGLLRSLNRLGASVCKS